MSIEYCHVCDKRIDTDFDLEHEHISEQEIERFYTTREEVESLLKEDDESKPEYSSHVNELAVYYRGGYVYE